MSNNKVKVVGYAKKVFFDNGIEYRNFNPDLVGVQLASDGGTPLFTMGNFSITTNMEPKSDKTFITNKFSNFISLSDLDLTLKQTQALLTDNAGVILNLDKTNLNYYALFGSLSEFVRVSLEDIITKWPASLYMTPVAQTTTGQVISGYTFESYTYDTLTEIATFKINTTFINNKFNINYLTNGTIINTFNATNDLRNLTVNYTAYAVLVNGNEYPVLGFTGSTFLTADYVYFKIKGNAFSGQPTNSTFVYHIKPNKSYEEQFFNTLPDFESYLLNRNVSPAYTAIFKYPIKSDEGVILYITQTLSWPVSDGYNIDFDTSDYVNYATKLLDISTDSDLYSSDLMNRFLVTESISDFDTTPVHLSDLDQDTSGQKMNKTLRIYGRSFDEINNFISGIAFANVVTYNKQDNTPDVFLKNLARVLGWELISSVVENDLLSNYVTTAPSSYSGTSVGLTAVEADVELWRRIILNTPWIWKSKGARKSIEFLLKFIGIPQGLISFNEYIYKANAPIDVELFTQALALNNLDTDLSNYPIDSNGYPSPLPDTPDMYFQNQGFWYRETGGSGATIDILTGNNPHLGPYDKGYKYINQFKELIPNFSAVTISSETITSGTTNLFTNYNLGTMVNYSGGTYVDIVNDDGSSLDDCIVLTTTIIPDPKPSDTINECGCNSAEDDDALSICVDKNDGITQTSCNSTIAAIPAVVGSDGTYTFFYYQYNPDGTVYTDVNGNPVLNRSRYTQQSCCSAIGGVSTLYDDVMNGQILNSGYVCCDGTNKCGCVTSCKWMIITTPIMLPVQSPIYNGPQSPYLVFSKQGRSNGVVSVDGCNCVANYTVPVPNIVDPYTGEVGYGCQLTALGLSDIALGQAGVLYQTYFGRSNGTVDCSSTIQLLLHLLQ